MLCTLHLGRPPVNTSDECESDVQTKRFHNLSNSASIACLILCRVLLPQARKLKDIIGDVRKQYESDWESKDTQKRQVRPGTGVELGRFSHLDSSVRESGRRTKYAGESGRRTRCKVS